VLNVLDGVGLGNIRRVDGQHLFQEPGTSAKLLGHAEEVFKEALLAWNQAKTGQVTSKEREIRSGVSCNNDVTES
jgi:hypothetical protein